jgi:tetratricopeptide (TPR) repeat protein
VGGYYSNVAFGNFKTAFEYLKAAFRYFNIAFEYSKATFGNLKAAFGNFKTAFEYLKAAFRYFNTAFEYSKATFGNLKAAFGNFNLIFRGICLLSCGTDVMPVLCGTAETAIPQEFEFFLIDSGNVRSPQSNVSHLLDS